MSKIRRYRKKPVIVEAIQYTPETQAECIASTNARTDRKRKGLLIDTLEGVRCVRHRAWIIKGVEGEFYPCTDAIFKKTYEELEDE